ncbi:MAG: rod shape-determining protein MreC [Candidatus Buchananbacteria bacterium]|nr:rod shape-determining protein MreC [Candidatus Buchananbacteria bacterium]
MFRFLRTKPLSFILLVVIVLLIFLHYLGVLGFFENVFFRVFSPIQHRIYSFGSGFNNIYSGLTSRDTLVKDNEKLKQEVASLATENAQLKVLIQESQELAEQRTFIDYLGLESVTARVIGKNPEANFQSIVLNKGAKDGIRLDAPLITGQGILVGKIFSVTDNSSQAILINDSRSRIAAVIQNQTASQGVVVGEHGLSLRMELIPQNESVVQGDLVVTSGLEPGITRGLVIGKISRIESEPNGLFQTAYIQPFVRIDNITIVSVLINRTDEPNTD